MQWPCGVGNPDQRRGVARGRGQMSAPCPGLSPVDESNAVVGGTGQHQLLDRLSHEVLRCAILLRCSDALTGNLFGGQ
ncbi:Uncharacterised protein [Mycobacteroides abscessus subsp. abscessus]|nr:Uncharacterised protein [Mycobacteroides abscessus subsp. abscessus]